MIMFENQAYMIFAESIQDFIKDRPWDKGVCECKIYQEMVRSSNWLEFKGSVNEESLDWGTVSVAEAALFLRKNVLNISGDRIWGLTFTLYPTGKFKIEYDYEKPEGYEESEEIITGDKINESLSNIKK